MRKLSETTQTTKIGGIKDCNPWGNGILSLRDTEKIGFSERRSRRKLGGKKSAVRKKKRGENGLQDSLPLFQTVGTQDVRPGSLGGNEIPEGVKRREWKTSALRALGIGFQRNECLTGRERKEGGKRGPKKKKVLKEDWKNKVQN